MNKRVLSIIFEVLIGITFFIPLLLLPDHFIFPFIVPKVVVFRTMALLVGAVFLVQALRQQDKPLFAKSWVTYLVGAFWASFALSTFIGVDWYKSFWDNQERMLGLFTITHYVLYFLALSQGIGKMDIWRRLARTFLFAGSIVVVLGLIQKGNPEFLLNNGAGRVSSTLGNAIYLGGYGLFLFFLGGLLVWWEKKVVLKYAAAFGALLGFLGIFISGTRGTMVGLFAGLFVLLVLAAIFSEQKKYQHIWSGLAIAVVLGVVGLFALRDTALIANIPSLHRLTHTSITDTTATTRFLAWEVAVEGWKERPLFGWGPNNFFALFNKHYNPKFLEYGITETWFDNAHNVLFNTLAVQGIVGLLLYIALFVGAIVALLRAVHKKELDPVFGIAMSAFLVAHFVHNFFVFENPTSYLYFFFVLAFVAFLTKKKEAPSQTKESSLPAKQRQVLEVGTVAVVGVVIIMTNWLPARANMTALKGIREASRTGDFILLEQALQMNTPHIDDVRSDIGRVLTPGVQGAINNQNIPAAKRLFDFIYPEVQKNLTLHPLDIRVHILLAQLAPMGAHIHQQPQYIIDAMSLLEQAHALSPDRQQIAYMRSAVLLQQQQVDQAVELLEKAVDDAPMVAESWWRLAATYYQVGQYDKAKTVLDTAQSIEVPFDSAARNIVANLRTAIASSTANAAQ